MDLRNVHDIKEVVVTIGKNLNLLILQNYFSNISEVD